MCMCVCSVCTCVCVCPSLGGPPSSSKRLRSPWTTATTPEVAGVAASAAVAAGACWTAVVSGVVA